VTTWPTSFGSAFCERFACPPEKYERELFWRTLHRHALALAMPLLLLRPSFFNIDFAVFSELRGCHNWKQFYVALSDFSYRNRMSGSALRVVFRVRVSGGRLLKVAMDLFGAPLETPGGRPSESAALPLDPRTPPAARPRGTATRG
jgi:hypothetical protein